MNLRRWLTPLERQEILEKKGYHKYIIELVQSCTPEEADNWTLILKSLDQSQVVHINGIQTEIRRSIENG